jgi:endonuclease G
MRRLLLLISLLLAPGYAASAESLDNIHIAHCLRDCPTGTPASNEIIVRHLYAVSINADSGFADWVSYRVLPGSIGVASLLPRAWRTDQLARNSVLAEDLSGPGDTLVQPNLGNQPDSVYRVSEFSVNAGDRGRLVPMTSFAATSYWSDLNLLSIMALMKSDLRLESWSRLDQAVNELVEREGELTVIAGPVYGPIDGNLSGDNVPAAFFKVVANSRGELAAFLFGQDLPVHASHCDQLSDLETVQARSGLRLFPAADDWPSGSLANRLRC